MYKNFEDLINLKQITPYKVSKETGVSQSTLSDWKRGVSTPKADKLQKIAEYLGVSVDYIMTGKESEIQPHFIDDEARQIAQEMANRPDLRILFDTSRKVAADDLKAVIEIVKTLENKKNM